MKTLKYFLTIFIFGLSFFVMSPVLAEADKSSLEGLNNTAGKINAYKDQIAEASAQTTVINRVGGLVALVLSFVGIIFLLLSIYAGIMWMTAQGNAAQVEKAKTLLTNATIGLVIISAAYSITVFVGNQLTN